MPYESNDKKKRRGRALGVVVATAVVTVPSLSCTTTTEPEPTEAGTASLPDAALAMDTGSAQDATTGTVDTDAGVDADDIADAYPSGLRG